MRFDQESAKMAIDIPSQVAARKYLDELVELIGALEAGKFVQTFTAETTPKQMCEKFYEKINQMHCEQGEHHPVNGFCLHCGMALAKVNHG